MRTAKAVSASLVPDNTDFPAGMQFTQNLCSNRLQFRIEQRHGGEHEIETLRSTLDEIVSHIQTATAAIEMTEGL